MATKKKKPSAWMILHDADYNEMVAIRISAVTAVHPRIRYHQPDEKKILENKDAKTGATIFLPSTSIRVREKVETVISLLGDE